MAMEISSSEANRLLERDLELSIKEERKAVDDYFKRADFARTYGDKDTALLYYYLASDEIDHERKLLKRQSALRLMAREVSLKI
ncbi:MAG: hypothetical protein PHC43_00090 [Candidatus Marinimicrobia bacterium]|jgi:rubrerythrin|nr:hypothetical protein [Candidatus Neomarinimicrobiota bacterium]